MARIAELTASLEEVVNKQDFIKAAEIQAALQFLNKQMTAQQDIEDKVRRARLAVLKQGMEEAVQSKDFVKAAEIRHQLLHFADPIEDPIESIETSLDVAADVEVVSGSGDRAGGQPAADETTAYETHFAELVESLEEVFRTKDFTKAVEISNQNTIENDPFEYTPLGHMKMELQLATMTRDFTRLGECILDYHQFGSQYSNPTFDETFELSRLGVRIL
jgi:protein-arginine kinase activator protein McsA